MKTRIPNSIKWAGRSMIAAGVLLAGVATAQPASPPPPEAQSRSVVLSTGGSGDDDAASTSGGSGSSGGSGAGHNVIQIESIEPALANDPAREVTWLGLSTEEASQALASQLGLKPGQGLVVVFVAPDSPAAKAGIQKFDVIEEIGNQTLVDPVQLRKLVQMQKEGDTIQLTLYRSGKKQTVSATLGKRNEGLAVWSAQAGEGGDLSEMAGSVAGLSRQMVDKQKLQAEVQRSMEEARKEIQEALRQTAQARAAMPRATVPPVPAVAPLAPLPPMVDMGNDATVTVTKDSDAVQTIVKSDDTGVIVIVASPKKHLTAHDPAGKLVFDGEIETPEQQKKVPAALWKKVKPMLQQIKPAEDGEPQPHAQSDREPKL